MTKKFRNWFRIQLNFWLMPDNERLRKITEKELSVLKWHNILKKLLDYFSLLRENIETFFKHFPSNLVWGVDARDAKFRNNSHIIHLIIVKNHVAEINARFRPQFFKVLFLPGKRLKNSYWLSYDLYDIKLRTSISSLLPYRSHYVWKRYP